MADEASKLASLRLSDIVQRDGRWVILDLVGKRQRVRTVPMASSRSTPTTISSWRRADGDGARVAEAATVRPERMKFDRSAWRGREPLPEAHEDPLALGR